MSQPEIESPEPITTEVQYPEWYKDRDWAGEQQERAYWEAFRAMKDLYGPNVPQDFNEFTEWLDSMIYPEKSHGPF